MWTCHIKASKFTKVRLEFHQAMQDDEQMGKSWNATSPTAHPACLWKPPNVGAGTCGIWVGAQGGSAKAVQETMRLMPPRLWSIAKLQSRRDAILEAPCAQNAPGRSTVRPPEASLPRNPTWESSHFSGLTVYSASLFERPHLACSMVSSKDKFNRKLLSAERSTRWLVQMPFWGHSGGGALKLTIRGPLKAPIFEVLLPCFFDQSPVSFLQNPSWKGDGLGGRPLVGPTRANRFSLRKKLVFGESAFQKMDCKSILVSIPLTLCARTAHSGSRS